MPTTAPPGYRVAVSDDFSGPVLDTHRWLQWAGEPGSDPSGWWRTPRSVAGNGELRLSGTWVAQGGNPHWTGGGEVTSGIGTVHAQLYGEYEWCMKVDPMPGTSTIALLWPADGQWPPEVDYVETMGHTYEYAMSLHYGSPRQNIIIRKGVSGQDASGWNVYTAIWKPGIVQIRENGVVTATISSRAHVPRIPMRFDIQTQAVRPHARVGETAIHWIVEYAPTAP